MVLLQAWRAKTGGCVRRELAEANVFYMNLPYGEAGAYLWI